MGKDVSMSGHVDMGGHAIISQSFRGAGAPHRPPPRGGSTPRYNSVRLRTSKMPNLR
jgi:hypothetical protein